MNLDMVPFLSKVRKGKYRRASAAQRSVLAALLACAIALALVAELRSLPYSTIRMIDAPESADAPPTPEGFSVGSLHWDVRAYAVAPELEPVRRYFVAQCGVKRGLAAARCLIDSFAVDFVHGPPREEFFDPSYDLREDAEAHFVRHEPGHCVTRSGLASAALLSVGIPARAVQLVDEAFGENVFEVWDDAYGWVLYNPSFARVAILGGKFVSATAGSHAPTRVTWRPFGQGVNPDHKFFRDFESADRAILNSLITFPEPWLYTHVGVPTLGRPFRGTFARRGPRSWQWGIGQEVTRDGAGLALLVALLFALRSVILLWRGNASSVTAFERTQAEQPGE